ncbi:response regulator [Cellulomonas carbonis]|uniref:Response regulatory domain-containing protein n=1 Tax=Cellulomonas carbonis T26 TaxID=947969 RepID=A0A0A0BXB0_9CELL|nr:response regulator [Cellulomonas carbonis]KGM12312.1 hypothetical protein N868_18125 [Cellulomonas carbonis T26]GGC01423.1 hypothetical protein GCM10010972_12750 [Cellulomonas carbonis]
MPSQPRRARTPRAPTTGAAAPHPARPADAIEAARAALDRLRTSDATGTGSPPRAFVVAGYVVAVLAAAGLVVHTFFEDGLQVTETSVLLLALALLAPFASRLKVIEFGGAKAEWRDDAANGLASAIRVLEAQHAALETAFESLDELAERTRDGGLDAEDRDDAPSSPRPEAPRPQAPRPGAHRPEPTPVPAPPSAPTPSAAARPRGVPPGTAPRTPVRRILWVDDVPMNNAYEVEAIRRLVDVEEVTSTADALELLATGRYGLVISDAVRVEDGVLNDHAAHDLIAAARDVAPGVPVVVYAGDTTLREHGASLREAGAADVVATHVDLTTTVRRMMRQVFEDAARARLDPLVVDGPAELPPELPIDALVEVPMRGRVAVELAGWVRRPKPAAVRGRADRLVPMLTYGAAVAGWIVTPDDVVPPELVAELPAGVEVVSFDELVARLEV